MFFHASKTPALDKLIPHVSNHGNPLIYFSTKKENVLVYLSNAIEKHCKQVGFNFDGIYKKWGSYGFTKDDVLRLEEYYPDAIFDTYKGESGYIYHVNNIEHYAIQEDIPYVVTIEREILVDGYQYIPDAYDAIMTEVKNGKIVIQKYEENNQAMLDWIEKTIRAEFLSADEHPEYKLFLKDKFEFLSPSHWTCCTN